MSIRENRCNTVNLVPSGPLVPLTPARAAAWVEACRLQLKAISRSLKQRLAYSDMTLTECAAAFLYWLRDRGASLVRSIRLPSSYVRLGWDDKQSF